MIRIGTRARSRALETCARALLIAGAATLASGAALAEKAPDPARDAFAPFELAQYEEDADRWDGVHSGDDGGDGGDGGGDSGSTPWSAHAAVGFTLSPSAALLTTGVEYEVIPQLGVGPMVQLGVDDDILIVAPTANARYRFDLSHVDDDLLRRFEPFLQGGLGFAWVEKDRPGSDPDDTEFLLNGGFGFEYHIDDRFSVGNSVLFNGMPADDAVGEDFFFSWQFLTARMRF